MFASLPGGATPPVPPPPAQAQPPKAKPPVAVFIVVGAVLLCGILACVGFGAAALFSDGDVSYDPPLEFGDDAEVIAGAEAIARGCELYAADNGSCPPTDQAWSGGDLAYYVDEWPDNPFTGAPMAPTGEPGDYIYHTSTSMGDGQEYLGYVEAVLEDGSTEMVEYSY